jgi:serine/threonine-protein kinase HipA
MKYTPVDVIEVIYSGRSVGALALDPNTGFYAFEYEPNFLTTGIELSPLAMPLSRKEPVIFSYLPETTYYKLPPFIADSLPDSFGNALINVWMARNGISRNQITPLDKLAYIGKRGMGALEFKPMIKLGGKRPVALEMNELISTARKSVSADLAQKIEGITDAAVQQLISVGTSAGGARAKAVVGINANSDKFVSGQFELPAGYEHWIIKFDLPEQESSSKKAEYGRIEYAYYLLAKECGIDMMESRLFELEGRAHFMTKRFDRSGNEKIHMQSLCAMAELDYKQKATHDYTQFFNTINELGMGFEAIDQSFLRMVFNVVMFNNDDHSKNHAFLYNDNKWKLSPAYDLTFAMNPDNEWLNKHLMGVDGKFADITDRDMLEIGRNFFVKDPDMIIKKVRSTAKNWSDFAKAARMTDDEAKRIDAVINKR